MYVHVYVYVYILMLMMTLMSVFAISSHSWTGGCHRCVLSDPTIMKHFIFWYSGLWCRWRSFWWWWWWWWWWWSRLTYERYSGLISPLDRICCHRTLLQYTWPLMEYRNIPQLAHIVFYTLYSYNGQRPNEDNGPLDLRWWQNVFFVELKNLSLFTFNMIFTRNVIY